MHVASFSGKQPGIYLEVLDFGRVLATEFANEVSSENLQCVNDQSSVALVSRNL